MVRPLRVLILAWALAMAGIGSAHADTAARLTSDAIWVNEEAGIVYAVSGGSLVEFPLPPKPPGWL